MGLSEVLFMAFIGTFSINLLEGNINLVELTFWKLLVFFLFDHCRFLVFCLSIRFFVVFFEYHGYVRWSVRCSGFCYVIRLSLF